MFDLFGAYKNASDLLFDETTIKLIPLQLEMSSFDAVSSQHFDPSFRQLPLGHKSSSCKVVLTSGAAATFVTAFGGWLSVMSALNSALLMLLFAWRQ